MGYRGRGRWHTSNQDMEVDASDALHGQFIRTRRGDDAVTGSDFSDWIRSGAGDDTVEGGGGNDVMFGGRGRDTAIFSGSVLDYQVLSFGCGRWNLVKGQDGYDFLHSFEVLQFDDFTLDLRANNDPLVVLRNETLETAQGGELSFQVDFYDIDGSSVDLVSASVTGGGTLSVLDSGASQGSMIGTAGGAALTFDPGSAYDGLGAGENTVETVTLVISDGQGGSTTVSYDILIEGQNDAPVALAVSAATDEDSSGVLVAADYSDIDSNDSHTLTVDTTGTLGFVTNNGDGTFSYIPNGAFEALAAGETATDGFIYSVDDGQGGISTETVTITIEGRNDAPAAVAVSDTADEDGPAVTVTADFSDADASDTHSFSIGTTGTKGAVTNNGDGTFNYSANGAFENLAAGETATDSFSYTVDDGNGGSDTETVTVTVTGQNDAPAALAVSANAEEDGPAVAIAADFSDADLTDSHAFSINTSGTLGSVTNNGGGTFSYNANGAFEHLAAGETATDSFTYTVDDGNGGTATETATITITGSNDAPVAQALTAGVAENSEEVTRNGAIEADTMMGNYGRFYVFDFDTGTATTVLRDSGANNTYDQLASQHLSSGNGIVAQVNPNNSGWGLASYVYDGGAGTAVPGSSYTVSDTDGGGYSVNTTYPEVLGFDDANKNVDTVALALNGLELSDGRTVDLDMEINGLDYEIFTTDDLRVDNVRFSADISDPADTVTVTAAYSDADLSDTHSISIDTSGTAGLVTDNGDGTFSYDANGQFEHLAAGETATDTFTYTVDDGNGGTDTETVTVTITGANDAPVALAVAAEVSENPQTAGSDSIGAYTVPNYGRFYIYDFDTGTAASVARDGGANNTFAQVANTYLSNGNGVVVQPNPNNTGWGLGGEIFVDGVAQPVSSSDWVVSGGNGDVNLTHPQWLSFGENNENISSIELTISDLDLGGGRTVDAHVSVGPLNYEYYTGDDLRVDGVQFSSAVNGPSPSVTVAADVSDPDSDTFVFSTDTSGTAGEVTNNGDGTFTYSANGQFEHLNDGETATDTFGYTVSDGNGGFDSELVTITILGSDDILFS